MFGVEDPGKCDACGKPTITEEVIPGHDDWEYICDCFGCMNCGKRFEADDDDTPTIARSEGWAALLPGWDDGWCGPCSSKESAKLPDCSACQGSGCDTCDDTGKVAA